MPPALNSDEKVLDVMIYKSGWAIQKKVDLWESCQPEDLMSPNALPAFWIVVKTQWNNDPRPKKHIWIKLEDGVYECDDMAWTRQLGDDEVSAFFPRRQMEEHHEFYFLAHDVIDKYIGEY